MLGDIFSLVLCDFHTVKWCKESIYMVHIKWTLWILIYVVCKKFVFCRKLILKALFRFNGTSKPSLTIALKILKTIKKPLIPMVGPSKNIQWWWSNVVKTIEKPLKSMVAWKKTLTIPSLWKIDHRHGLVSIVVFAPAEICFNILFQDAAGTFRPKGFHSTLPVCRRVVDFIFRQQYFIQGPLQMGYTGCFFSLVPPLKVLSTKSC